MHACHPRTSQFTRPAQETRRTVKPTYLARTTQADPASASPASLRSLTMVPIRQDLAPLPHLGEFCMLRVWKETEQKAYSWYTRNTLRYLIVLINGPYSINDYDLLQKWIKMSKLISCMINIIMHWLINFSLLSYELWSQMIDS